MAELTPRNCADFRLAANIAYDACNPASKGAKGTGYICNFDDIDSASMNTDSNKVGNRFKSFKLKEGKKLYRITQAGKKPFNGTTTEASVGDYRTTWNKTVQMVILNNGADVTENIIDKLANGKFVIIVENAFSGHNGDNNYEIYGFESGLALSEGNAEKYNEDYGGGWQVTMVEENAPTSGLYVLADDVDSPTKKSGIVVTREELEGLVVGS